MTFKINKQAVANSFSKAASHYDQFAQLQRDIGKQLFSQVNVATPSHLVDLGCGTGYFSEKLASQYNRSIVTCFDLSPAMLEQAKSREIENAEYQQGDIDLFSFSENSIDLIFSNLVVQWSENLHRCLGNINKSLKPGGKAYLSTLLDGTLDELTQAWKKVDDKPHTNRFLSLQTVQNLIAQSQFSQVNIKTETRVLHYKNVIEVMRALKGIGANHVHQHQASVLTGKKLINQLEAGYSRYKNETGHLNLTYQVCYIEVIK